jgi:hypothetical protein
MSMLLLRYHVADEGVRHVIGAVDAAIAALRAKRPEGIRYAYYRRADSSEFIALLELEDGVDNPLLGIEAARALQATVAKWVAGEPPVPQALELLGSYGFGP